MHTWSTNTAIVKHNESSHSPPLELPIVVGNQRVTSLIIIVHAGLSSDGQIKILTLCCCCNFRLFAFCLNFPTRTLHISLHPYVATNLVDSTTDGEMSLLKPAAISTMFRILRANWSRSFSTWNKQGKQTRAKALIADAKDRYIKANYIPVLIPSWHEKFSQQNWYVWRPFQILY